MSSPLFQTIVVATDGSATAAQAVERGAELAGLTGGGQLDLVGAYDDSRGQEKLESALATLASQLGDHGLKVTTITRQGDPVEVILDVAKERGADLIVVGNLGMTGARRFLLSSIPDKVSHRAECSVLVVNTAG
ncbi:MAG: universal stress protein [Solirubrobacteraceae bacterium]|nr:universal stress protein [Patulibacter sp.]